MQLMHRVNRRAALSYAGRTVEDSGTVESTKRRKRKSYKVVLETVTQEKKKLRSTASYNAAAPPGYTFVPAGTPELTEYCKEICRNRGLTVHVVSARPRNKIHNNPDRISHHVHRIGYHFPNHVVDQGCNWLGYRSHGLGYRKERGLIDTSRLARSLEVHSRRLGLRTANNASQETREQIGAAIRDLFPKIPEEDLRAIIEHAFREGTSRVGNAAELTLSRRVQLAVVAHIRHVYTEYDNLLRSGTYLDARAKVEQSCLDQLVKWRGEDGGDQVETEDIFREFIVIDDDESDDSDGSSSGEETGGSREPSVEFISSKAADHDLEQDDDSDYVEEVDAPRGHTYAQRVYGLRPHNRDIPAFHATRSNDTLVHNRISRTHHAHSIPATALRPPATTSTLVQPPARVLNHGEIADPVSRRRTTGHPSLGYRSLDDEFVLVRRPVQAGDPGEKVYQQVCISQRSSSRLAPDVARSTPQLHGQRPADEFSHGEEVWRRSGAFPMRNSDGNDVRFQPQPLSQIRRHSYRELPIVAHERTDRTTLHRMKLLEDGNRRSLAITGTEFVVPSIENSDGLIASSERAQAAETYSTNTTHHNLASQLRFSRRSAKRRSLPLPLEADSSQMERSKRPRVDVDLTVGPRRSTQLVHLPQTRTIVSSRMENSLMISPGQAVTARYHLRPRNGDRGPNFRERTYTSSDAGDMVDPSALALTHNDPSDCTLLFARRLPRLHPAEEPSAQHRSPANRTLPSRYLQSLEEDALSSREYHDTAYSTHREPL